MSATDIKLANATITFSPKVYTVFWDVPENNHACDAAHEDPVAAELFRRLEKGQVGARYRRKDRR